MLEIDLARPYHAPSPVPKRVSVIALVTLLILLVLALVLEVASRVADGVVERRKAAPGFDAATYGPGLLDSIALSTLDPAAVRLKDLRTLPHPYLGYALKPSWSTPKDSPQQCSHNSLGFRGKETTWEKPPGVYRIVTLGGSSVYGQSETKDSAVWSQRLEEYLNQTNLGYRFEVINGGCPGYTSFESLIQFTTRLVDLHPDLLIHYEAINDMRAALYTPGGPVRHDNTHFRETWPVDRPSSLERLLEHSRAYLVLRRYCTGYTEERRDLGHWAIVNYDPNAPNPYDPEPVPDLGFDTYRRNLVQLIAAARSQNCRVAIVTQPLARYHLDGAPSQAKQLAGIDRIQAIERAVGKELDVPVLEVARVIEAAVEKELQAELVRQRTMDPAVDEAEILKRAKGTLHPSPLPKVPLEGVIFRHDVHPYDFGSDLIARTIAAMLLDSEVLPRKEQ